MRMRDFLDVQHDVGDVFAHAGNRRELVQHAVDLTAVTAAPCSDDSRTRRSALPSVRPKPRSSGSATRVASGGGSAGFTSSKLVRLDQFLPVFVNHGIDLFSLAHQRLANGGSGCPEGKCGRRKPPGPPNDTPEIALDAAALARTHTIVRDRRHVADRRDREDRQPAARAGPTHGPNPDRTSTSSVFMPCSGSLLGGIFSGDLRGIRGRLARALEPILPADDQAIALPCASVMVIMVLLNVEFTCATPEMMFLRSRRRTRVAS
jgi:hypothetical protein